MSNLTQKHVRSYTALIASILVSCPTFLYDF